MWSPRGTEGTTAIKPMDETSPQPHHPLVGWLFLAALLWRLCVFGGDDNTLDPLASSIFACFAAYGVWRLPNNTLGIPYFNWWVLLVLFHWVLWPFWPTPFQQLLHFPSLLAPLFIVTALCWFPLSVLRLLPMLILIAGALHGLTSLWQYFFVFPDLLQQQETLGLTKAQIFRLHEGRTLGLSSSPDLSAVLCMAGVFSGLWLMVTRHREQRVGVSLLFIPALCGLGLSRSTGVFLAMVVGCLLVLFLKRFQKRLSFKSELGVLLVMLPFVLFGFRGIQALSTSTHERLLNWRGALDIFSQHWPIGVGPGGFGAAYEMARPVGSNITRYAHGLLFQMPSELGLAGLFLLLLLATLLLRRLKQWHAASQEAPTPWLWGGVAALWAHACIDYDFQAPQTACLLAIFTFLLFSEHEAFTPPPRPSRANEKILILALTLITVAGTYFLTERKGMLLQSREAPFPQASQSLESWITNFPADLEAHLALMSLVVEKQVTCEAHCEVWHQRSQMLTQAWVEKNPAQATGWFLAAQMAKARGEPAQARQWIDRALVLHPGMPAAWLFKLHSFSNDPNYPAWYKEAEGWLHGRYQLKGLPEPKK